MLIYLLRCLSKLIFDNFYELFETFVFSKSFQDVQSIQANIWSYQQYAVVPEYDRPSLFIPFSTIFGIIALVKIYYQWYLRVRYNYVNPLQRAFSKF